MREINLIPDVKMELVKAIKARNWILFGCIIVAGASVVVTLIIGSIVASQALIKDSRSETLKSMSAKISEYGDLNEFLTIQNQLKGIESTTERKIVFSRLFNVLQTILPSDKTVTLTNLQANFGEGEYVLSFEGKAQAVEAPYNNYTELEKFKKSLPYVYYDYGNYVDKNGATIPSFCIVETNDLGELLVENKNYYAYWMIEKVGCNPSANDAENDNEIDDENENSTTSDNFGKKYRDEYVYDTPLADGTPVVRIWRTPQVDSWYRNKHISEDGVISGVQHFESECIHYYAEERDNELKWTNSLKDNNMSSSCQVVNGELEITDQSNNGGVLSFTANLTLNGDVFSFANKHVIAIAKDGQIIATDSYIQVQDMFSQPIDVGDK